MARAHVLLILARSFEAYNHSYVKELRSCIATFVAWAARVFADVAMQDNTNLLIADCECSQS